MNFFIGFIILFFATILLSPNYVMIFLTFITLLLLYFLRKKSYNIKKILVYATVFSVFIYSVDFIFNNVFEQRHRDRFNIVMGLEEDYRGSGYNTNQSRIAFASGGMFGEGFLKGSQTRGNFVPEQHTDYIFQQLVKNGDFLAHLQ